MKVFKDANGKDWTLRVNYSACERVKELAKVDLLDLSIFEKIGVDPIKLIDVLYAICKEEADKIPVSKLQFADALAGESLEAATEALIQEYIDFFPPSRREVLRKMDATAKQLQGKALETINRRLDSGDLLRELEKRLNEPSGNGQESAVSTPAPSPSVSLSI